MGALEDARRRSLEDPEGYWGEAAGLIDWVTPPARTLTTLDRHHHRWFEGGVLNTCHNALDRHADGGRGEQVALIHDSPVTGTVRRFTYAELRDAVARFAGALAGLGVGRGDTVIVYMPMVPEAAVAMLACARLGAVHSVVFGGFAPHELAVRIDDARPAVIVSASCGIEGRRVIEYMPLLEAAVGLAEHPPRALRDPAARRTGGRRGRAAAGAAQGRPRPRLGRAHGRGGPGRPRAGRRLGPPLHPLHLGHDGGAQGRGPRQRRARRGPAAQHARDLRHPPRPGLLGRLGRGLGRRAQLHRLRAAPDRLHQRPLRGQAGGHAGPGRVLAGDRRPRRAHALHRAHGVPGHPQGGPRGPAPGRP